MSFIHGKTGYRYYSVNEKIKYYKKILNSKPNSGVGRYKKEKAFFRLIELKSIKNYDYSRPSLLVTDDKKFGNTINKPRLCVGIAKDNKGRILTMPIIKRTTKSIILDSDYDRQIGDKRKWIDSSDVYETKYVDNVSELSNNDIDKIRHILIKK